MTNAFSSFFAPQNNSKRDYYILGIVYVISRRRWKLQKSTRGFTTIMKVQQTSHIRSYVGKVVYLFLQWQARDRQRRQSLRHSVWRHGEALKGAGSRGCRGSHSTLLLPIRSKRNRSTTLADYRVKHSYIRGRIQIRSSLQFIGGFSIQEYKRKEWSSSRLHPSTNFKRAKHRVDVLRLLIWSQGTIVFATLNSEREATLK